MSRAFVVAALLCAASTASAQPPPTRDRASWIELKDRGFPVPEGTSAVELLVQMNALLASPDPVLRDDVAYSAAERWILRDRRLSPGDLRRVMNLWLSNLQDGLGTPGDDRVFKRSFSALCLSLVAASDFTTPFLEQAEFDRFFDRTLEYFEKETDLRGFDPARGWMHTVAHTADVLQFLGRNPKLPPDRLARVLAAVTRKLQAADRVFEWGEADRLALALHAFARRAGSDPAFEKWIAHWATEHARLWEKGPQVSPRQFALVENAKQILRSLFAALSADTAPTPAGDKAKALIIAILPKMR